MRRPAWKPFWRRISSLRRNADGARPDRLNSQLMTPSIATFGEIMLRLTPPGFERLLQSPHLNATFGGGEANVAVSLAQFGAQSRYLTVLPPKNAVADALLGEMRRF